MRINKFIALSTGASRRAADVIILEGRVLVDGLVATPGHTITEKNAVIFDGKVLPYSAVSKPRTTILFHKPVGYVVSRNGQGSRTIYDLLPEEYHSLKPVGRLDKDSSGLLLLTDDGELANELTHPSNHKIKIYTVTLNTALQPLHQQIITDRGIMLDDGWSKFELERMEEGNGMKWRVIMREGRNRQIRRTFSALNYTVTKLHRIQFGDYTLDGLERASAYRKI